ncbi:MAG: maleylpyruvate isomerase N-terminal domain-containing protein [Gemmatimonadetes bacterium]|nr:maleylpyruvate isomerase N-terminal domain-containing protein [Gemmatimonadota bacterium]
MNISDILRYGHQTVLDTVDGLPDTEWDTGGVCGVWSVKDIVAHLASFEHVLVDVLNSLLAGGPTPYLERWAGDKFNEEEVAKRKSKTPAQVFAEYKDTHAKNMSLVAKIPAEKCRQAGTLPWYGEEYSLDDFVVYTYYGHKREHCAQIKLFRKRLG